MKVNFCLCLVSWYRFFSLIGLYRERESASYLAAERQKGVSIYGYVLEKFGDNVATFIVKNKIRDLFKVKLYTIRSKTK